jgi:hypothetical protein
MTSIGALKDIAIIGSHPTTRQVLKISDYQLVEAITNQLSLFETYPTISMIMNDSQAPAKLSRTLSNESRLESEIGQSVIYPFKTLTPYERDYHLFQMQPLGNFTRFDSYCRKILLEQNQRALERQNLAHLNKVWDGLAIFTHDRYLLSAKLTFSGLTRSSTLDVSHYKTQGFNMKTLLRDLQSRDQLFQYKNMFIFNKNCVKCGKLETQQHIYECSYTVESYQRVYSQTKEYFSALLRNYWDENHDKKSVQNYPDEYCSKILEILRIDKSEFLKDIQAQGVANLHKLAVLAFKVKLISPFPSHEWLYLQALGCFKRSLEVTIWRPRTAYMMKENSENKKKHNRRKN